MSSQFIPKDFNKDIPVALIAGKGSYPFIVKDRLQKEGVPVRLLALDGETHSDLVNSFPEEHRTSFNIGQLGRFLKALKQFEVSTAIMAGQVTPGKLFKGYLPDLKAMSVMAKLKKRNAETIFGAIANEMQKIGVELLDARAFLDDQLADNGSMVGRVNVEQHHINHGIQVAKEMARLDVGQGVVVAKGTVLAVEAFEGTDEMLRRAGLFDAKQALFIKTVKPNQDYRFDVPVFGLNTLKVMSEAGIYNAGLEAEKTLILEKEKVLEEAKRLKINLFGYTLEVVEA